MIVDIVKNVWFILQDFLLPTARTFILKHYWKKGCSFIINIQGEKIYSAVDVYKFW